MSELKSLYAERKRLQSIDRLTQFEQEELRQVNRRIYTLELSRPSAWLIVQDIIGWFGRIAK